MVGLYGDAHLTTLYLTHYITFLAKNSVSAIFKSCTIALQPIVIFAVVEKETQQNEDKGSTRVLAL